MDSFKHTGAIDAVVAATRAHADNAGILRVANTLLSRFSDQTLPSDGIVAQAALDCRRD